MVYKVLLVDDQELVRCGISRLLEDYPNIKVIGDVSSGEEAVTFARDNQPDIVLMDLNMPGMGGLEATRRLLQMYPETKVIVLTVCNTDPFPARFLEVGAMGYLTKGSSPTEMKEAIEAVIHGQRYISSDVAQQLALNVRPGQARAGSPFEKLSQRELQVLIMVAQGQRIQDISRRLSLSPKTISTYRHRLFDKLGVSSDVELAHLAMRHGIPVH